jgi:putative FmdB family regulatory protein
MPLYEYQCDSCGARFELIRKFSDPPLQVCPTCGAEGVRKLISSPAFQFKGSGWYVTDYAKKSEGSSSGARATAESKADAKSDADKSGAKGESKPDAAKDAAAPAADKTAADKPATTAPAPAAGKDK